MRNYNTQTYKIHDVLKDWKNQLIIPPSVPELQRPFTWSTQQICELFDSLFKGLPIGNLIVWDNIFPLSDDKTPVRFQRILIDGQQRLAALTVGFGIEKTFDGKPIKIAFNPITKKFKEQTPNILADKQWIPDISSIVSIKNNILDIAQNYNKNNSDINSQTIGDILIELSTIHDAHLLITTLTSDVDFDTVTLFQKRII
jgi:uncharacterized protein with ParB-like and HNH nuclease domain